MEISHPPPSNEITTVPPPLVRTAPSIVIQIISERLFRKRYDFLKRVLQRLHFLSETNDRMVRYFFTLHDILTSIFDSIQFSTFRIVYNKIPDTCCSPNFILCKYSTLTQTPAVTLLYIYISTCHASVTYFEVHLLHTWYKKSSQNAERITPYIYCCVQYQGTNYNNNGNNDMQPIRGRNWQRQLCRSQTKLLFKIWPTVFA